MTIIDDEYRVRLFPFPGNIKAAVRFDKEGFPNIYINDKLSPAAQKRAFMHELRHILRDDINNNLPIEEVEREP